MYQHKCKTNNNLYKTNMRSEVHTHMSILLIKYMPQFAFSLKVDKISSVVRMQHGLIVFRCAEFGKL